MKIRNRIVLSLLLLSLLPLVVVALYTETIAEQALKQIVAHHFEHISQEKANAIDHILDSRIHETRLLAQRPDVLAAVRTSNEQDAELDDQHSMQAILQQDEAWIAGKGDTDKAQEIARNSLSRELKSLQARRPEHRFLFTGCGVRGEGTAAWQAHARSGSVPGFLR